MTAARLLITASPHLHAKDDTPTIMWNVVGSLVPIVITATYFFGPSALLVIGASTVGAVLTERLLGKGTSIGDG